MNSSPSLCVFLSSNIFPWRCNCMLGTFHMSWLFVDQMFVSLAGLNSCMCLHVWLLEDVTHMSKCCLLPHWVVLTWLCFLTCHWLILLSRAFPNLPPLHFEYLWICALCLLFVAMGLWPFGHVHTL